MKRQIIFIVTILTMACSWGFVDAQSKENKTSLSAYMEDRSKPLTLSQRITSKGIGGNNDIVSNYRSPAISLTNGDVFSEQYLVSRRRELDIMRNVLDNYRIGLINRSTNSSFGGTNSQCQGLTNLDLIALMSKSDAFMVYLQAYDVLTGENFDESTLNLSCGKRAACMGGSIFQSYQSMTVSQSKWSICSDTLAEEFIYQYETQLPLENFDIINQYNNIFSNGVSGDAPFDLINDIKRIQLVRFDEVPEFPAVDYTSLPSTTNDPNLRLYGFEDQGSEETLPNELLASTQQLLNILEVDTVVDPLKDSQIADLMGQFTTVSDSKATVPTGNILNACVDTSSSTTTTSLLEQLKQAQQIVQQYSQSLNTNQTLNDVINGSRDVSSLSPTLTKLSILSEPISTIKPTSAVASLSNNPLGFDLAQINRDDIGEPGGGESSLTNDINNSLGITPSTGVDGVKQCVSSCNYKYDNRDTSQCVQTCKTQGTKGGILNLRACNQQCFNAQIACKAACLCRSTTEIAQKNAGTGELSKIHQMFEARRCVVPTNKVRNPTDRSCIRIDPDTGLKRLGSLECYLNQTIEQGTYNRESGKGGLRVKPREWMEGTTKFDLTKMIRITVSAVTKSIRNNHNTKKDIKESLNKQEYEQMTRLPPLLSNIKAIDSTYSSIQDFIDAQIMIRKEIGAKAQEIELIVSQ